MQWYEKEVSDAINSVESRLRPGETLGLDARLAEVVLKGPNLLKVLITFFHQLEGSTQEKLVLYKDHCVRLLMLVL